MKVYGIRTLNDIRDRCRMVDGHWLWAGALSASGKPRIWAPDLSRGGSMAAQYGARASWQAKHGKPVPEGHRVFADCSETLCVNPDHSACRTSKQQGEVIAKSGEYKNQAARITANRAINRQRTKVTPEILPIVLDMSKTGKAVVEETGICRTTVSRIRRAQSPVISGPFGLLVHSLVRATA